MRGDRTVIPKRFEDNTAVPVILLIGVKFKIEVELWPGVSVDWNVVPYTKGLQVRSLVREHIGGNQLIFLSHINVSFSTNQ